MAVFGGRSHLELRGLKHRTRVVGAVVVLNGARSEELERACAVNALTADRCLLVAVDGGLRACRRAGRRPDLWVGDGDSSPAKPGEIPRISLPIDKGFSDLAGALAELRKRRVQVVTVAGMLGGRLDHEWCNLLELARAARWFAAIVAPTRRGTVLLTRHGASAVTVRGRTLSLLALTPTATVSLTGTRWELDRRRVPQGSLGLSNIAGTQVDLTVHAGTVALIFVPPSRAARRG